MLADKIVIIDEGRVLQKGSPMEISLNPKTVEAAMALGLKNLFKIHAITRNKTEKRIIISTEVGNIEVPAQLINNMNDKPVAAFIDPTQVKISNEEILEGCDLLGEIVAIIPDPMVHQSTLLIKIIPGDFPSKHQISTSTTQNRILHVQIPITDKNYQISNKVHIIINPEALKLYK
jgi:ABC-type Fe3+/spermidine/putrescine transport system ATPase subunit